jgi:hypothetical protein
VPTVVIAVRAFENRLRAMTLPRVVLTPHLMGRPLGAPGDSERQRATLRAALDLLERATQAGTIVHMAGTYRPTTPVSPIGSRSEWARDASRSQGKM